MAPVAQNQCCVHQQEEIRQVLEALQRTLGSMNSSSADSTRILAMEQTLQALQARLAAAPLPQQPGSAPTITRASVLQELAQEFWRQAYSSDHELILTTDIFTKVVNYSRPQADTYNASDASGRTLSRNVGDNIANVFNDFAELYYSSEFTSTEGGAGAQVLLTNTYPTYSVSIVTAGAGYTIGKVYTINTVLGGQCTFTVNGINGSGGVTSVNNITGTPNGTLLRTDNSYLTDIAQLRLGSATDQEILQYNITTYLYYGLT
jgi:hypothetical protein